MGHRWLLPGLVFFLPCWRWLLFGLMSLPSVPFGFCSSQSEPFSVCRFSSGSLGAPLTIARAQVKTPRSGSPDRGPYLTPSGWPPLGSLTGAPPHRAPDEVPPDEWQHHRKHVSGVCRARALFFENVPATLAKKSGLGSFGLILLAAVIWLGMAR